MYTNGVLYKVPNIKKPPFATALYPKIPQRFVVLRAPIALKINEKKAITKKKRVQYRDNKLLLFTRKI